LIAVRLKRRHQRVTKEVIKRIKGVLLEYAYYVDIELDGNMIYIKVV
jgi:ribosomal protein L30/L7E